jgi:uncharacterized protein
MATGSLLALLDDIATILDDVSVLTKVATQKTAGVLGDDLALNAQQVAGVRAERELPVVWAVAKGSLMNKAILVPAALLISAFLPWLVTPLLVLGGLFLCYEGVEKLAHKLLHRKEDDDARHAELTNALTQPEVDFQTLERDKIKGAIRTDFILSAEIIVISLGAVAAATLPTRIGVLVSIAIVMTVGVYGIVAGIVKLDDLGLYWSRKGGLRAPLGRGILAFAPWLMKGLSIAGTAAMFLVGGGILVHGVPALQQAVQRALAGLSPAIEMTASLLADAGVGIAAGAVALVVVMVGAKAFKSARSASP